MDGFLHSLGIGLAFFFVLQGCASLVKAFLVDKIIYKPCNCPECKDV